MTSNLDTSGESPLERRRQRAFRIQAWLGAATFLIANFALQQWGDLKGHGPWRVLWAVLPLLPVAWLVTVTVRRMRQLDEYQIKLLVPGLAVGFTAAIVAGITVGTLSAAAPCPARPGGSWRWSACWPGRSPTSGWEHRLADGEPDPFGTRTAGMDPSGARRASWSVASDHRRARDGEV